MTSATTQPSSGTRRRPAEGYGLIVFASVLLLVLGCLNLTDGIAAVANSHVFIPAYPFWSLTIMAVDVVALWGLRAYGSRQNVTA